nr:TetR family transcriptional regulator [Metabacillus lacus]
MPEEKRQSLLCAVKQEFSRAPLSEASITNIIKSAGIPRGSFYQYFEGKEDAFFFLLNELSKKVNQQFMLLLEENSGDLFQTLLNFYEYIIGEEEHFHFLKNVFLNMTYKIEHAFSRMLGDSGAAGRFFLISSMIDKSRLNIEDERELLHLFKILSAVTFRNFIEKFARDLPADIALQRFSMEIDLLKRGLSKK